MTFEQRCRISEQCLPEAPYREMLTKLHDEMLKALAQPEQKPVAWMSDHDVGFKKSEFGATPTVPLYTNPPQRPWVGLTDEEINDIAENYALTNPTTPLHFARAIEAAIKDNNT